MATATATETATEPDLRPPSLPLGPPLPPIAQVLPYVLLEERAVAWAVERYGDAFTCQLPSFGKAVIVTNPEDVRQIFTTHESVLEVGEAQQPLEVVYGPRSILLTDGPPHTRLRKVLVPPLRASAMAHYRGVMERAAERALERWPLGRPFAFMPEARDITLEIILRAIVGIDDERRLREWTGPFHRMLHLAASEEMSVRYVLRDVGGLRLWRRFNRARAACDRLVYAEIARRRRDPGLEEADDIVALLLRARTPEGEPLDDAYVRDQLITLLVGGHETPASTLAWAMERLVRHPEAMERLTAEAREGTDDAYAEAVIQETLRLRPPIVFVARRVKAPFELAGHRLPTGTLVVPYFPLIHRRPDLYPDPLAFKPERFLGRRPPAYGWVPFGGGAHACLGGQFAYLELKATLHTLLRRGVFAPSTAADEPMQRRTITMVPRHGAQLLLRGRRAA
jgi:hypothetical protein